MLHCVAACVCCVDFGVAWCGVLRFVLLVCFVLFVVFGGFLLFRVRMCFVLSFCLVLGLVWFGAVCVVLMSVLCVFVLL